MATCPQGSGTSTVRAHARVVCAPCLLRASTPGASTTEVRILRGLPDDTAVPLQAITKGFELGCFPCMPYVSDVAGCVVLICGSPKYPAVEGQQAPRPAGSLLLSLSCVARGLVLGYKVS
jgi:hypothetical protein